MTIRIPPCLPITEEDLKAALLLIRNLRVVAILSDIHPIAMRIALKVALKIDNEFAKQHLTGEQEKAIDAIVEEIIRTTRRGKA